MPAGRAPGQAAAIVAVALLLLAEQLGLNLAQQALAGGRLPAPSRWLQQQPVQQQPVNTTLLASLLGSADYRPFVGAFQVVQGWAAAAAPAAAAAGDGAGRRLLRPLQQQQQNHSPGAGPTAADGRPLAMDPWAYARYNPQFGLWAGVLSRQAALAHYERVGRLSGAPVICARIPLFISYPIKGGLCNLAFSIIHAWTIAVAMGADLALAKAHKRRSFQQMGYWSDVPFATLFDLEASTRLLAELGVRALVDPGPALQGGSGGGWPVVATTFQRQNSVILPNGTIFRNHSAAAYHLHRLVPLLTQEVVKAAAQEQAARALRGLPVRCDEPPIVHLTIDHTAHILRSAQLPLAAHLAHGLRFSEVVERRAALIATAMATQGYVPYNGLHLRLELDHLWISYRYFGNDTGIMQGYKEAAARMGWVQGGATAGAPAGAALPLPVYVASGLFTYPEGREVYQHAVAALAPFGSVFLHREDFEAQLNASMGGTLAALDSEQAAAVDLLMVVAARQFVGTVGTSFSWFAAQRRLLQGRSPRDTALVGYWPNSAQVLQRQQELAAGGEGGEESYFTFSPLCSVASCAA